MHADGINRRDRYQIGVEAKSRVRDLHEAPGEHSYENDYKGIYNLVRKAKKQAPDGVPFVIFIDVNLPPAAGYDPDKKPWLPNIARALDPLGDSTQDNPDPFTLLIPTNFGDLFCCIDDFVGRGEWGLVIPKHPRVPFDNPSVVRIIWESVGRYSTIPREV